jgi:hypothetical protein
MHFIHCSEKSIEEKKLKEAKDFKGNMEKDKIIRSAYHVVDPSAYWGLSTG